MMIAARPILRALPPSFVGRLQQFVTAHKRRHACLPTQRETIAAVVPNLTYGELRAVFNERTMPRSWRIAAVRRAAALERAALRRNRKVRSAELRREFGFVSAQGSTDSSREAAK